jgi:hypothetical protein
MAPSKVLSLAMIDVERDVGIRYTDIGTNLYPLVVSFAHN